MAASVLSAGTIYAQGPCARIDAPWWQLGATRFFQGSGEGQRATSIGIERHFVDRRVLRRAGSGYRLEITRTRLGLRDTTVRIAVEYAASGAVARITGDTASLARDVSQLLITPCRELTAGRTFADLGWRTDTSRNVMQQSVTRTRSVMPVTVGAAVDTLGGRLTPVVVQRSVSDTSRGLLLRTTPNQQPDTLRPWTTLGGDDIERQLVRALDGVVVFREHARRVSGRGWLPPHPVGDTVSVRVETASLERVVDSATAAGIVNFPRRGDLLVSATTRDTVALHYREWRGDTLVVRQFRRSGWRDELRTVWRESQLVGAVLNEPGNVTQQAGPFRRVFRVAQSALRDDGARDSVVATPTHGWAIALDGFEDALVPALLKVPVDSQPHRFSMYGIQNDRGAWLDWSVTIVRRGAVRVAKFTTLQRRWVGAFVFTPTGELLLVNLGGGPQGVSRVPAAGTRLAALLDAEKGRILRDDLMPPQ
jgi:hypothetical protein